MPRTARIAPNEHVYHILTRGNNRQGNKRGHPIVPFGISNSHRKLTCYFHEVHIERNALRYFWPRFLPSVVHTFNICYNGVDFNWKLLVIIW